MIHCTLFLLRLNDYMHYVAQKSFHLSCNCCPRCARSINLQSAQKVTLQSLVTSTASFACHMHPRSINTPWQKFIIDWWMGVAWGVIRVSCFRKMSIKNLDGRGFILHAIICGCNAGVSANLGQGRSIWQPCLALLAYIVRLIRLINTFGTRTDTVFGISPPPSRQQASGTLPWRLTPSCLRSLGTRNRGRYIYRPVFSPLDRNFHRCVALFEFHHGTPGDRTCIPDGFDRKSTPLCDSFTFSN